MPVHVKYVFVSAQTPSSYSALASHLVFIPQLGQIRLHFYFEISVVWTNGHMSCDVKLKEADCTKAMPNWNKWAKSKEKQLCMWNGKSKWAQQMHKHNTVIKILISWSGPIATAPKLRNIFIVLQNITRCSTIRKYAHYNAWTSVLEVRLDLPPAVMKACTSLPSYGGISILKKRVLQTYLEHRDNLPSITEWSYCSDATIWPPFTVQPLQVKCTCLKNCLLLKNEHISLKDILHL